MFAALDPSMFEGVIFCLIGVAIFVVSFFFGGAILQTRREAALLRAEVQQLREEIERLKRGPDKGRSEGITANGPN